MRESEGVRATDVRDFFVALPHSVDRILTTDPSKEQALLKESVTQDMRVLITNFLGDLIEGGLSEDEASDELLQIRRRSAVDNLYVACRECANRLAVLPDPYWTVGLRVSAAQTVAACILHLDRLEASCDSRPLSRF